IDRRSLNDAEEWIAGTIGGRGAAAVVDHLHRIHLGRPPLGRRRLGAREPESEPRTLGRRWWHLRADLKIAVVIARLGREHGRDNRPDVAAVVGRGALDPVARRERGSELQVVTLDDMRGPGLVVNLELTITRERPVAVRVNGVED